MAVFQLAIIVHEKVETRESIKLTWNTWPETVCMASI